MPAIITDTFDYDDIVRVLDLDEAFVQHQVDARTLNELKRRERDSRSARRDAFTKRSD